MNPVRRLTPAEQRALRKGDPVLLLMNDGVDEEHTFLGHSTALQGHCSITPVSGSGVIHIVRLDRLGTSQSRYGEKTIHVG